MPRSNIPHTRRRGAVYWWRRRFCLAPLAFSTFHAISCELSLRTREPGSARGRAAALTAFSERLKMSLQNEVALHGISEEAMPAIFIDELRSYRNELVHLDAAWKVHPQWSTVSDRDTDLAVFEHLWAGIAEQGLGVPRDWAFVERHFASFDELTQARVHSLLRDHPQLSHAMRLDARRRLEARGIEASAINTPVAIDLLARARAEATRQVRCGENFANLAQQASLAAASAPPSLPGTMPPASAAPPAAPAANRPADHKTSEQDAYRAMTPTEFAEVFIDRKFSGLEHRTGNKRKKRMVGESTYRDVRWAAQLLEKALPPATALSAVTAQQLQSLDAWFDRLPVTVGKSPRDREPDTSLEQIAHRAEARVEAGEMDAGDIGLSAATTNKHWHNIARMHAELCNLVPSVAPIDIALYITPDIKSAREARLRLSTEQGRALFSLPPWTGCAGVENRLEAGWHLIHDGLYFVLLLVWYTGARREEICKLMVSDLFDDSETPFIYIRATATGGVKTANGTRKIPVHSELIRLGFLAFARAMREAGEPLLFPELYPNAGTKRAIGDVFYKIWWIKLKPLIPGLLRGQAMHAARHAVSDALKQAGVTLENRNDVMGHSQKSLGQQAERYSEPLELAAMREMVEHIPIVTDHLPTIETVRLLPRTMRSPRPSRSTRLA